MSSHGHHGGVAGFGDPFVNLLFFFSAIPFIVLHVIVVCRGKVEEIRSSGLTAAVTSGNDRGDFEETDPCVLWDNATRKQWWSGSVNAASGVCL